MLRNAHGEDSSICVIIPCFKVKKTILQVIDDCPDYVDRIFVVDDACPDGTGDFVRLHCKDNRVVVTTHDKNAGVGAAVISGYKKALELGFDIAVKVDGDGQMNPILISDLAHPILFEFADYTKGNRFFNIERLGEMPKIRIFGNICLSFFSKFSSGYWSIFDPNNGFTAIRVDKLKVIPLDKLDKRFFFESDILFRLNLARSRVRDVAMHAQYGSEESNLRIRSIFFPFLKSHSRNFAKRIIYSYFLRDFSIASIQLVVGVLLLITSIFIGLSSWVNAYGSLTPTPVSQLLLITVMFLSGLQLFLSFITYDLQNEPK